MKRARKRTVRGRGFYLLSGTLCATVVLVVAACCAISLLTMGRATQQESNAIDSAIKAFDLYQQQRSPLNNSVQDAAAQLEGNDEGLAQLAAAPSDTALREQAARRLAAFERANAGDVDKAYVILGNPSGEDSFVLGSQSASQDARTRDPRLSMIDINALAAGADSQIVTRLSPDSDDPWSISVYSYAEGVTLAAFYAIPEVPNLDIIEPISEIAEMYFVDGDGNYYAYSSDNHLAAIDTDALFSSDSGESGILAVTFAGEKYRMYYHHPMDDGHAFVIIVPDIAANAYRQFVIVVVLTTAVFVALGCAAGLFLTRKIYEPLQQIIGKLAPKDQDVQDEFKLISFAIEAMENRLGQQGELVDEYRLMRLLRGRAALAEEGAGFFFAEPSREVALAIVRADGLREGPSGEVEGHAGSRLEAIVRAHLQETGREFALCEESGFVFAVVDAQGGGVAPLFAGIVQRASKSGDLISAFVSNVHAGADKLNLCYRESVEALKEGTAEKAFNKVVRCERSEKRQPERRASGTGAALPASKPAGSAEDLLAYVRENYRDPSLSASLVAERFGISNAGVSRAFARAYPEGGFLGYLHKLRMDKAEELLRTTELNLPDIAESVGYGSALTMSRAFKRYRDTTPGAYRKGADEQGQSKER